MTGTADWWAYKQHFEGILNLYVGPGLFVAGSNYSFALGGRIPVGLNIYPIDFFELFVELAPTLAVHFNPTTPVLGIQGPLVLGSGFD